MLRPERMRGQRRLDPNSLGDHVDRLYRAALGLTGSREDAEDLVQETFARVLRKPRVLHSEEDIGYLLRVLRNTYISSLRSASRRPQSEPLPDSPDVLEDTSVRPPDERLQTQALYAMIAELPEPFREALVAVDLIGLSYREAARALRVREATLTTRLHRARQRLAGAIEAAESAPETSPPETSPAGESAPADSASRDERPQDSLGHAGPG